MGKNKSATIRYQAMDKCFSDTTHRYTYTDIDVAVRKAYLDITGVENSVSRQAFYTDIENMMTIYDCPIEKVKDGKYTYFRYADPKFSLSQTALKPEEEKLIQNTVHLLSRFDGLPNYDWVGQLTARLSSEFSIEIDANSVVSFEENSYLRGMDLFFTPLFNAAVNKQVVSVQYKPFHKVSRARLIHPYMLKQYNNRWYLIGLNDESKAIVHLAIDRVQDVEEVRVAFIDNTIDLTEHFEDAVGITVPYDEKPIYIELEVSNDLFPYIETKPINGSQKIIERGETTTKISIQVYDTYELRSFILSKGNQMKVIEPESLANSIQKQLKEALDNYSNV